MASDPLTGILDVGGKLIDRLWPDPAQRDAARLKLAELQKSGELAQLAVDQAEAQSTNWFIAGWRPAAGWVAVISLALVYWPKAIALLVVWCIQAYAAIRSGGALPSYPDLGLMDILGLLGSLLGFGGLRTFEKWSDSEGNR